MSVLHRRTYRAVPIAAVGMCLLVLGMGWCVQSCKRAVLSGPEDILRRWRVSQYVLAGRNPYEVALGVLRQEVGPVAQTSLRERPLFHIPLPSRNTEQLGVLSNVGPPESVYPPSAQMLLSYTVGLVPERMVLTLWTVLNLICLPALAVITYRWVMGKELLNEEGGPTVVRPADNRLRVVLPLGLVLAGLLVWAPTQQAIISSQLSIQVAICLLLAALLLDHHPVWSGLLFSLALVKPSMALPFLILPLVKKQWQTLLVVVATQVAAIAAISALVGQAPWVMIKQWVSVSAYFTQGPYSIQTVLNRLQLDNTMLGFSLVLAFVLCCAGWSWRHRRADTRSLFDFLCFVSVLWTYHGPYDLVILFIPLSRALHYALAAERAGTKRVVLIGAVAAFLIITLGTWPPAYVGRDAAQQTVRWLCRLTLVGCFACFAFLLMRNALFIANNSRTDRLRCEAGLTPA